MVFLAPIFMFSKEFFLSEIVIGNLLYACLLSSAYVVTVGKKLAERKEYVFKTLTPPVRNPLTTCKSLTIAIYVCPGLHS